jgi:hypothetical protein
MTDEIRIKVKIQLHHGYHVKIQYANHYPGNQ